uniref:DH domain-containing protein n=1 Tax=Photinus pyralis TaxID=7054 RepID=A0A1Y1KCR1_PHOPY
MNASRRRFNHGSSTDLMPSIMGAIDAIWEGSRTSDTEDSCPKRTVQANNFANLSHNVQKILANVPDEDLNKNFSSEESLRKLNRTYSRTRISPEKSHEDIISTNVQKMLSNLPDVELVTKPKTLRSSKSFCTSRQSFLYRGGVPDLTASSSVCDSLSAIDVSEVPKPLGSYLHTSPSGIASRTPVGRKNLKLLQVPSESGTNSTTSSEVSRPVSLTSLGSCSSSSSGGHHQQSSAYLASAESLDSDPEPTGSQGSADSGIAEQPTMSPEQCVLQEVMDTETIYVSDLREVIEGYLDPWRTDPDCPLQPYLQDLFSNLEEIYLFNRSFLEELQKTNCDPSLTANAFLHNDAGFSVYTHYCTNYPRTMMVLTELTGDEKMAPLFRERQLALRHALPLGSYLLKPVQRILKYHLLLQRLSKQCDHPHQPTVDLALATMTGVASHINTMKRKHEHAVRVQEIQSQLYGWNGPDLTALGELIAEGTFRVGGARGRRHIFLFDKVLLIAKSRQEGYLAYKSHIMCSNLMLVEQVRGEPLSFHILPFDNPRQQCTLRARSPQHKREWTLQLKRVILENYSAEIPSHARQLVMQLGQNASEISEDTSPLKQHSTPQYLERRSRVRKTRDFSSRRAASSDRSFVSLTSWRRKSEPGFVNQYTSKTLPKRITKIKKSKDYTTAKFYTDLSDSEICESQDKCEDILESSLECETETEISNTLEKVVSDLLMQNEEFHKLMTRQRRGARDCEPWTKSGDELPSKADSLPRDFQLNDQLDCKIVNADEALSNSKPDVENEDLQESDLSSQLNDSEHPDHRIYRKSAIRFSLVQRFRAIISEEQKRTGKPTVLGKRSENIGARIAHPDYADPQKLFRSSQSLSQSDLTDDLMGHCENLDLSISETEVLSYGERVKKEFEESRANSSQDCNSSQNSDSYYERLLEKNLNEDVEVKPKVKRPSKAPPPVPTKPTRLLSTTNNNLLDNSKENGETVSSEHNFHTGRRKILVSKGAYNVSHENDLPKENSSNLQPVNAKGWVKTIVGRFE